MIWKTNNPKLRPTEAIERFVQENFEGRQWQWLNENNGTFHVRRDGSAYRAVPELQRARRVL